MEASGIEPDPYECHIPHINIMDKDYTMGHGSFQPYYMDYSISKEVLSLLENFPDDSIDVKAEWIHLHTICKQLLFDIFEKYGLDYCCKINGNNKMIRFWIEGKHYYVTVNGDPEQFNDFDSAFDYWVKQVRK